MVEPCIGIKEKATLINVAFLVSSIDGTSVRRNCSSCLYKSWYHKETTHFHQPIKFAKLIPPFRHLITAWHIDVILFPFQQG